MGTLVSGLRMSAGELGCSYAALVLSADGAEISEDNIKTLLKAANIDCEAYWPALFAKALTAGDGIEKLIVTPGGGGGGGGGGGAAAGGAGGEAAAEEAKKKTTTEEDDMPAAGGLFDEEDDY